jgi:DNA polymerase
MGFAWQRREQVAAAERPVCRMKFFVGDLANIEGRVNAWLAGETWKIQTFYFYDWGVGPDVYNVVYKRSFGRFPNDKEERQLGKIQDLACGYGGGVGAYLKFVMTYKMKLSTLVEPVKRVTDQATWEKVLLEYDNAFDKHELEREIWAAVKILVRGWRNGHPAIVQSWYDLEDAVIGAVSEPNVPFYVYNGRGQYMSDGNFLYCCLPSGRVISYAQPYVRWTEQEYVKIGDTWRMTDEFFEYELEIFKLMGFPFKKRGKNVVWFWGMELETKRWRTTYLYGGHLCENFVQAAARCILDRGMTRLAAAGYPIIMHSHDEIVAWVQDNFGSKAEFERLMTLPQIWLAGLPLSAKVSEDKRYMK